MFCNSLIVVFAITFITLGQRMFRWVILFFFASQIASAQQMLEGKIVDKATRQPVPFASIGIMGTSEGTSSNLEGEFSLFVKGSAAAIIKISCIGYESLELKSTDNMRQILLNPTSTQLSEIVILSKSVNPRKVVRKVFANVSENYIDQPFLEKLFYRHYCKDDSAYGRLIEAYVEVWKHDAHHSAQKAGNENEAVRISQLRRSLDRTTLSQGHEPIAINYALQTDIIGYQNSTRSEHFSFYSDVSTLRADFERLDFHFGGITHYDGMEVYEIFYENKKDSLPTTSGKYLALAKLHGVLYITTEGNALVKTEEVKEFNNNSVHSACFYRQFNNRYYPYHFVRDGFNRTSDGHSHSFHVEMMAIELVTGADRFAGKEPSREELLKIPYDSSFWNNHSMLKTTPLEKQIIIDLGGGIPLDKQFAIYRDFEINTSRGGEDGLTKLKWLLHDSRGKRNLYLVFWAGDCRHYLVDMEYVKRLNKIYKKQITFVFVSLDEEDDVWSQRVASFNLFSDGIINYRIGKGNELTKLFLVNEIPSFYVVPKSESQFQIAKHPSDPQLKKDFNALLQESN
jgi:hypothetical protein